MKWEPRKHFEPWYSNPNLKTLLKNLQVPNIADRGSANWAQIAILKSKYKKSVSKKL